MMRKRTSRRRELSGGARVAAAISAGLTPALVALLVLLVIAERRSLAVGIAVVVWIALSAVMWSRFGRPS